MSEAPAAAGLLDARGCITSRGLGVLADALPGQAPPELAAHVASCAGCQDRLLRAGAEAISAVPVARRRSPWTNLTVVVMAFVFALVLLTVTLLTLGGG